MKKLFVICVMALVWGCAENDKHSHADEHHAKHKDTPKENPFAGVEFASKYDTICGMPLTAGISDTLEWQGKIYGFCAEECKNEFKEMLSKNDNP